MMLKKICLLSLLIVVFFGWHKFSNIVNAQQAGDVFIKQDISDDIEELERTYKGQLNEYRQYQQQYEVDKTQHKKLKTLASLETMVQSTKQAMLNRDQVLITYFRLLELKLVNTPGIDVQVKTELDLQIKAVQKILQRHLEAVSRSEDSKALEVLATDFKPITEEVKYLSRFAQRTIKYGLLQSVYDRSVSFEDDLMTHVASSSSYLNQGKIDRAFDQIDLRLDQTNQDLKEISLKLDEAIIAKRQPGIDQKLQQVFVAESQIISYLEEVLSY